MCEFRTKLCIFLKHRDPLIHKHYLSVLNEHNVDVVLTDHRGLTPKVKSIVEDLIYNYDTKPRRIRISLMKKYKRKVDVMPSLKQVQNYVKKRRNGIGDNNNLDEIRPYIERLRYYYGVTQNDELFVFGTELGEGTENDPFQLGFTSYSLLKNIELVKQNGIFHLDCTYKIVKYNYPLIKFRLTDIERKFFPICFIFTSHEKEEDFTF